MEEKVKIFPVELSDVDVTFGVNALTIMPCMNEIPREYHMMSNTKWNKLVSDWFFFGVKNLKVTPKKGIDKDKAIKHLRCIIGSFEPAQEHKEAAAAYLMSEWFEDATWEKCKRK